MTRKLYSTDKERNKKFEEYRSRGYTVEKFYHLLKRNMGKLQYGLTIKGRCRPSHSAEEKTSCEQAHEVHCACVPILRSELAEAREMLHQLNLIARSRDAK